MKKRRTNLLKAKFEDLLLPDQSKETRNYQNQTQHQASSQTDTPQLGPYSTTFQLKKLPRNLQIIRTSYCREGYRRCKRWSTQTKRSSSVEKTNTANSRLSPNRRAEGDCSQGRANLCWNTVWVTSLNTTLSRISDNSTILDYASSRWTRSKRRWGRSPISS